MIRCPDCHKEISESAISCPNCGLPRPLYELQNRERRAAESLAAADRRRNMQLFYAASAFIGFIGVGIIVRTILTPWTGVMLTHKLMNFLGGGLGCAIAYGCFRYARHLQGTPS